MKTICPLGEEVILCDNLDKMPMGQTYGYRYSITYYSPLRFLDVYKGEDDGKMYGYSHG